MRFLRRLSLQTRLMSLFIIPGLFVIALIPVLISQFQSVALIVSQPAEAHIVITQEIIQAARLRMILGLAILAAIFFALFLLTLVIGRSILTPLDDLRASLTSFRIGKHTLLFEDDSRDEFGELVRALNKMAQQLTRSYINLEERNNQRAQALAQRAQFLQAAAELARDTTSISDIDQLLDRAVNLIRDRFDLYFVGVYLLDPTSNQAILRSGTGEIGRALLQRGHRYQVGEIGLVGQVVATGEARVVNDVQRDFVYQRHLLLDKTAAQAVLPLKIGSQIVGALDVHSTNPNAFEPSAMSVLQIMADQLSVAIQNASLVEDLSVRIQETNLLYQRYAQENWSVSKLRPTEIGYEFDQVRVMQYREQLPPTLIEKLKEGKPVIVEEKSAQDEDSKQIVYAPLIMYNQLIGVIGLEQPEKSRQWTSEDITTLETITNQISLALDNSRLLEETQRRSDQIRLLQVVTSIAASQVHLESLLAAVAEPLQRELMMDYCDILWFEPDGISATIVASLPQDSRLNIANTYIPVADNPLFQHLMEVNRSVELYDVAHHPLAISLRDIAEPRGLSSVLVTPLFLRGEVNGAILLCSCDPDRRFSSEEIIVMDQISLQLASALEVARTFEQTALRAERERQISEASQRIRETLDFSTILRSAAQEVRRVLDVPEVTIRIAPYPHRSDRPLNES